MEFNSNKFELFLIRQGLSRKTIREHLLRVGRIIGESGEITEESANEYVLTMIKENSHPATINKHIQAIKKYCEFCKLQWATEVKKLREPKPVRILLAEHEIEEFINVKLDAYKSLVDGGVKYKIYWSIIAYSGARPSEILNLTVNDVDFSQRVINIRKSKTLEGRNIPISDLYLDQLKKYILKIKTKYLFPSWLEDRPISHNSILKDMRLRKEALNIGKDVKPYSFRHSFITRMLNNNVPLFVVQDIVGHRDAETTRKYYHGSISAMHDALKKDSALRSKLSARELVQQVVVSLKNYNLETRSDIDPAKLQIAYSKIWESIKDC